METIEPRGDRVLVRACDPLAEVSGVLIPASAQETQQRGIVVAVGDKVVGLRAGQEVIFVKYGGTAIANKIQDGELLMLKDEDILAVVLK